jgi:hypothetical protein
MMASFDLPFAPDASRLAYILEQKNGLVAVVHGKEGPPTPSILPIALSPDFKRSAYWLDRP